MSAILELLLRLAYVLLAALGLRAFERQWEAGLRRDAELDELLAIAEERRQRRPIAAFGGLRPRSARCTISDEGRRLLREGRTKEVAEALAREISARSRA